MDMFGPFKPLRAISGLGSAYDAARKQFQAMCGPGSIHDTTRKQLEAMCGPGSIHDTTRKQLEAMCGPGSIHDTTRKQLEAMCGPGSIHDTTRRQLDALYRPGSVFDGIKASGFLNRPGSVLDSATKGLFGAGAVDSTRRQLDALYRPGSVFDGIEASGFLNRPGSVLDSATKGLFGAGAVDSTRKQLDALYRPGSVFDGIEAPGFLNGPGSVLDSATKGLVSAGSIPDVTRKPLQYMCSLGLLSDSVAEGIFGAGSSYESTRKQFEAMTAPRSILDSAANSLFLNAMKGMGALSGLALALDLAPLGFFGAAIHDSTRKHLEAVHGMRSTFETARAQLDAPYSRGSIFNSANGLGALHGSAPGPIYGFSWMFDMSTRLAWMFDPIKMSAALPFGLEPLLAARDAAPDGDERDLGDRLVAVDEESADALLDWLRQQKPSLSRAAYVCHAFAVLHAIGLAIEFEARLQVPRSVDQVEFSSGVLLAVLGLLLHLLAHRS